MEVPAPHRPVTSFRELLTHLGLITVGVLIALSFEGIVSWSEHRALVREARVNILNEIRDNRASLAARMKAVPEETKNIGAVLDVADLMLQHKPIEGKLSLEFRNADLRSASRATAEVTGAFALMEYDEVKKYASAYLQQELFVRVQTEGLQNMTRALASVGLIPDAKMASVREVEDWKAALRLAQASLLAVEQIGQGLLEEYGEVLAGSGAHQ